MGSLRRQLIGLTLVPKAALAEVCDKIRPGWVVANGPQSAAEETAYVLFSPVGIGVLGILAVALIFPRRWLAILAVLPAFALCALLALGRRGEMSALAITEGCVGSITPTLLILALLCAVTLTRAFRRPHLL